MTRISKLAAAVGLTLAAASTAEAFNGDDVPIQGTKLTGIALPSAGANRMAVTEVTLQGSIWAKRTPSRLHTTC